MDYIIIYINFTKLSAKFTSVCMIRRFRRTTAILSLNLYILIYATISAHVVTPICNTVNYTTTKTILEDRDCRFALKFRFERDCTYHIYVHASSGNPRVLADLRRPVEKSSAYLHIQSLCWSQNNRYYRATFN